MCEPSELIAELVAFFVRYEKSGVSLEPAAVVELLAILGGIEDEARRLAARPRGAGDAVCDALAAETRKIDLLADRIAHTNAVLRAAGEGKVIMFPRAARGRGDIAVQAALAMLRDIHLDDGGAA